MAVKNATELLSPLTVDDFIQNHWGKKPVHIKGHQDKFKDLFRREEFFDYSKSPRADMFMGKADDNKHFHQLSTTAYNARALFRLGMTIQMEDVHWLCTPVRELLVGLKHELGLYCGMEAAAFVSPPGAGYGIHYDPNPDIWALQISGTKTWKYSPVPAAKYPIEHVTLNPYGKPQTNYVDIERPDESDFIEIQLEPGDVFYFPAGTWHTARADEESCHIVLASQIAPWTDFVLEILRDKLLHKDDWRQIPLHHHAWPHAIMDVLKERIDEMKSAIADLDLSDQGDIKRNFLYQAQLDEGRDENKGMSPWAYRAHRVSYQKAKELIDYDTEKLIIQRREDEE
ncbi:MAG: cupin domain-containing protein [Myxococcota bacterium]|nr:cupin domain-containing protein [Myxococcota bacterium]